MTSKLKTDVLETVSGSGTIALTNQLSGMTHESMPVGSIIQAVQAQVQVAGSNVAATPNEVNGVLLYSVSFTPVSANSRIVVATSSVLTQEIANGGQKRWLGAWAGAYQIGVNSATAHYTTFANNYNTAELSLNHGIDSWGTTARTIVVRAGGDGAGYVNTQAYSDYAASLREIGITITEIKG